MRMGQTPKRRRNKRGTKDDGADNSIIAATASGVTGAAISPNVIGSLLGPSLSSLATQGLEDYADAVLVYEQELQSSKEQQLPQEGEVDADGTATVDASSNNETLRPPNPYRLFSRQADVDEFQTLLVDTAQHFTSPPEREKTKRKGGRKNKKKDDDDGGSGGGGSNSAPWKIHANAAKFERLLDEKYGRLRPFITSHPEVEAFIKGVQRKHAMGYFSPIRRGESPFGTATSVMLLFMLQRNQVRFDGIVLVAMFCLVGLQPWALVTLVAMGHFLMGNRKNKRVFGIPKKLKVVEPYYDRKVEHQPQEELSEEEETELKYRLLNKPVGTKYNPADLTLGDEPKPDVLFLGTGPSTLYAAALLARAGRKVVVLSTEEDVSRCATLDGDRHGANGMNKLPFDVSDAGDVAHLSSMQDYLAPALCTATDVQGGIRFAKIGSESDGYAHTVLSVPGLGTGDYDGDALPVVLNAGGPSAVAAYAAEMLGDGYPEIDADGNQTDGESASLSYMRAAGQIVGGAEGFHLSKLFPAPKFASTPGAVDAYKQASIRPTSAFLNRCLPLHAHVRSLMAAIGMPNENLNPDRTSMAAHVTNVSERTGPEGMAYPIGGPRALCAALTSVIEQCGGRVVGGVAMQELLFDDLEDGVDTPSSKKKANKKDKKNEGAAAEDDTEAKPSTGPKPRCKGVRLENGQEVTVAAGTGAVVSHLGLIPTFLYLFPADVRVKHGVPVGLPALSERRPLMKLLVALKGSAADLSLTGADWYRLPNAALPRDEMDAATGQVKFGAIGVDGDEGEVEETLADVAADLSGASAEAGSEKRGKRSRASPASSSSSEPAAAAAKPPRRTKFVSGASWMKVSFPSAKDPSWTDRYGKVSTCVVTVEADDDFVRFFDAKPKVFSILKGNAGEADRLRDRIVKDLLEVFPQLKGNIECSQMCGPFRAGLSHNPARYAIPGNRPQTPYPGLYVGGADLTVGDSFSGAMVGAWMAANAVVGYSFIDHTYLGKNITSDLARFVDEPSMATERDGVVVEDVAVPFTQQQVQEEKKNEDDAESGDNDNDDGEGTAAESSKEK